MRTIELLREYATRRVAPPDEKWKRLVWMGAEMLNMAHRERGTTRSAKAPKAKCGFEQGDLFEKGGEQNG